MLIENRVPQEFINKIKNNQSSVIEFYPYKNAKEVHKIIENFNNETNSNFKLIDLMNLTYIISQIIPKEKLGFNEKEYNLFLSRLYKKLSFVEYYDNFSTYPFTYYLWNENIEKKLKLVLNFYSKLAFYKSKIRNNVSEEYYVYFIEKLILTLNSYLYFYEPLIISSKSRTYLNIHYKKIQIKKNEIQWKQYLVSYLQFAQKLYYSDMLDKYVNFHNMLLDVILSNFDINFITSFFLNVKKYILFDYFDLKNGGQYVLNNFIKTACQFELSIEYKLSENLLFSLRINETRYNNNEILFNFDITPLNNKKIILKWRLNKIIERSIRKFYNLLKFKPTIYRYHINDTITNSSVLKIKGSFEDSIKNSLSTDLENYKIENVKKTLNRILDLNKIIEVLNLNNEIKCLKRRKIN
jgi:hypothetical protein